MLNLMLIVVTEQKQKMARRSKLYTVAYFSTFVLGDWYK